MGLDITAYRGIEYVGPPEGIWPEGQMRLYVNPYFPEQSDGLRDGQYTYEKRLSFRAGSYRGYSAWRNELAKMVHGVPAELVWASPEKYPAFIDLIYFSDCEGTIGHRTADKLLTAFCANVDKAREHKTENQPRFYTQYILWLAAFALAADGGAVSFR